MKHCIAAAVALLVACKSSSSTTSQPSTSDPAPMPSDPAPMQQPPPEAPSPTQPPSTTPATPATPATQPTTKPTTPTPTTPTQQAEVKTGEMGQSCGTGDVCSTGLTCVKYFGIAGARGPQFATCEVKCDKKQPCPSGTKCRTIADGPGAVCRP